MNTTTVHESAGQWVDGRRARRELRPNSVRAYRQVLDSFCHHVGRDLPVRKLRHRHVEGWLGGLELAPASLNLYFTTLHSWIRWLADTGQIARDLMAGMSAPKLPRPIPRRLSRSEVAAVLEACESSRDELMVLLGVQMALRCGEIATIEIGDIDWQDQYVLVNGKGGYQRLVPWTAEAWEALLVYWTETGRPKLGRLLRSERPRHEHDGLQPATVSKRIRAIMQSAGLDESAHALRHTAAQDVLREGANIRQVQMMLGHHSLQSTSRYLGPVEAVALRDVMDGRTYRAS